jgi:hypothetical protein
MKLILPQNLICCSLNEDTIDPFILAMSRECYQSHDQEVFLLPVQTWQKLLMQILYNGWLEIYYYLYAGSTVMRAGEVSG